MNKVRAAWRQRDIVMILGLVLAALLACGGDDNCSVELDYKGKTVPGAGKTLSDARRGGCWKYCIEHDQLVDRTWKKWAKANSSKSMAKTLDLESEPSLKRMLDGCESSCV